MDPTAVTAKEMQQLLHIIRRLVERLTVTDEFDNDNVTGPRAEAPDDFGLITRLARLQELLNALLAGGVGVLAAAYYNHSWTEEKGPRTVPMPVPGNDGRRLKFEQILEIRFVPRDVRGKSYRPTSIPNLRKSRKCSRAWTYSMNDRLVLNCRGRPHAQAQQCAGRASPDVGDPHAYADKRKRKRASQRRTLASRSKRSSATANGTRSRLSSPRPDHR